MQPTEYYQDYRMLFNSKLTCLGPERLVGAIEKSIDIDSRNISGAIVECGTYRCGCLAAMSKYSNSDRHVWGFDTFAGLPTPIAVDGPSAQGRGGPNDLLAHIEDAWKPFDLIGARKGNVHLVKGLFQDTLAPSKSKVGPIALLRLDGDWYESTRVCLYELYDQVSTGGWIIIDDYGHWPGCKKAVDEFITRRGLSIQMTATDYTERYWMKNV